MQKADIDLRIRNGRKYSPYEQEIIDIFTYIWYKQTKQDSTINSFKRTVISVKIDGPENNLVNFPDNILQNFDNPNEYIKDFIRNIIRKESNNLEKK